jgi:hypothetical protein
VLFYLLGNDYSVFGNGPDSGFFILPHEAAIAFGIGTENSSEFTFKTFICHNGTSLFKVSNYATQYVDQSKIGSVW